MTNQNCRNCMFNKYEPAGEDPEEMTNNCYHREIQLMELCDTLVGVSIWMREQAWDEECMCPELTPTPRPGFREKS